MTDWWERAACRFDPDMWFTKRDRIAAVHICRRHCPVVQECQKATPEGGITYGVMGGVAFDDHGQRTRVGTGKGVKFCGPHCKAYRKAA